jgi:hypothetical protein
MKTTIPYERILADSKKMRVKCTKDLIHGSGSLDFKKGEVYDVIEQDNTRFLLKNEWGQRHSITDEWKAFFYFC